MYSVVFECLCGSRLSILDLGCGIGILLYYLGHRGLHLRMIGVDWDAGRIAVAQQITQAGYQNPSFIHQDARKPIQFQGDVVMLDLLHYIDDGDQRRLLKTVGASIAPGGCAIIRQCPRDSSNRFKLTNVVERLGHALRWHKGSSINFPTHKTKKPSRCGVGRRLIIICSCFVALKTMFRRAIRSTIEDVDENRCRQVSIGEE